MQQCCLIETRSWGSTAEVVAEKQHAMLQLCLRYVRSIRILVTNPHVRRVKREALRALPYPVLGSQNAISPEKALEASHRRRLISLSTMQRLLWQRESFALRHLTYELQRQTLLQTGCTEDRRPDSASHETTSKTGRYPTMLLTTDH